MTASQLADHLGMNEATVIQFAQRLGYRGYPQLVAAIRRWFNGNSQWCD